MIVSSVYIWSVAIITLFLGIIFRKDTAMNILFKMAMYLLSAASFYYIFKG